jgi:quercetin dioxygenase-like cupin family protein
VGFEPTTSAPSSFLTQVYFSLPSTSRGVNEREPSPQFLKILNIIIKCGSLIMLKVNVDKLDKMAMHGAEDDPNRKVTGNFALYSAMGTKSGSAVYFELEPGKELGAHTDSAEEIVYVIDGTVEATLGNNEKDSLSAGELGVVPVMELHNFRNVGKNTAKVIGFFSSPNVVSTFEKVFMPGDLREFDTTKIPAPKEAVTTGANTE